MHISPATDWHSHLVESTDEIHAILRRSRRIAVLGIKPESRWDRPAHYVAAYTQEAGFEVIPVPVYYPEVTEILGQPVFRRLVDVPGDIDIVNVFRRSEDTPPIADEAVKVGAKAIWLQSGIASEDAAARAKAGGLVAVMDACIATVHSYLRVHAT